MIFFSSNPVHDAEFYQQHLEAVEASRDYIKCDYCGGKIYRENNIYEGDIYYQIDGENICEDCIREIVQKYKRRCV